MIDAVILNQQVAAGVWSEGLLRAVRRLAKEHVDTAWVADSRDHPGRFAGMTVKLNSAEAARLCGRDVPPGEVVRGAETDADLPRLFRRLGGRSGGAVVVTRGAEGAVAMDASGTCRAPGVGIEGETDPVGAGDTFVSALACSLGGGLDLATAITLGTRAAAVTVRKLRRTGTASEAEVRAVAGEEGRTSGRG